MMGGVVVCVLHVVTAGEQGPSLGSDETEIVLLAYVLIDLSTNKILGLQEYVVRPSNVDLNGNFLSEQVLTNTRLTESAVKNSAIPLDKAINQFEMYLKTVQVSGSNLFFVTDGQYPLRQVLLPESCHKNIQLPSHYCRLSDLRKDSASFYSSPTPFNSIGEILMFLDIAQSGDHSEFYAKEVKDMVNVVQRLITDGHKFSVIETINLVLEPGICSKDEEVDSKCVVRARGLPWQSSDQDIAKFFRGLNISKGGVALCLSALGRRNGEALVRFTCPEHREMALKRHKHHLDSRYIELYEGTGKEFVNVAGGCNTEAQAFLTRGAQVIIRMRGLPYDCTGEQVMEFFDSGDDPCRVMDGTEGVLFVRKPDGRSTGDAFVLFKEESDAVRALAKHRELIGTRYIELFRSTTAEVQQVLNRTMEAFDPPLSARGTAPGATLPPLAPLPALLPQHIITSGTRKDCIRLRGLPYEAQVEHILEFLGDHAKNIVYQGVHMVYNSQGQPSGEAFIQMDSEASAFGAAQLRHHRNMTFGKKQRYIEVFQCSGEDMHMMLTGGLGPGAAAAAAAAAAAVGTPGQLSPVGAKTLLSPGIESALPGGAPAPWEYAPLLAPHNPATALYNPLPPPIWAPQVPTPELLPLLLLPKVTPLPSHLSAPQLKRTWAQAFPYPHHLPSHIPTTQAYAPPAPHQPPSKRPFFPPI